MMDPIAMLRQDHENIRDLFRMFREASWASSEAKWDVVQDIVAEMSLHAAVEEEIFYKALGEFGDEADRQFVTHYLQEHQGILTLANEVGTDDPHTEGKLRLLMEEFEEHASEEEVMMFPRARELLRGQFEALMARMVQRKQHVTTAQETRTAGP